MEKLPWIPILTLVTYLLQGKTNFLLINLHGQSYYKHVQYVM